MSFIYMRMKNDFHIKGWAINLVLTQRPGGTRKWPIPPMWMHADRSQVELFICSLLMWPWHISKQLMYLVLGCSPSGDQTSPHLHPRVCHLCSNCYKSRKNTNRRILDKHSWSIWQEKVLKTSLSLATRCWGPYHARAYNTPTQRQIHWFC